MWNRDQNIETKAGRGQDLHLDSAGDMRIGPSVELHPHVPKKLAGELALQSGADQLNDRHFGEFVLGEGFEEPRHVLRQATGFVDFSLREQRFDKIDGDHGLLSRVLLG